MDIDRGLLKSILKEGMTPFYNEGVRDDMISGSAIVAYRFIEAHWREYRKVPDTTTVLKETGVDLFQGPDEPVKFWSKEIKKRHLYNSIKDGLNTVMDSMEKRDSEDALKRLETIIFSIRENTPIVSRPVSLFANPDMIMEAYERAKTGITGVPCPFPSLNHISRGWQPEDLCVIAARPGVGKTYMLILLAKWAWAQGKKVLIASTEMSNISMSNRTISLVTKTAYGKIKHGTLTTMEEEQLRSSLQELKVDKRFLIMGGGFDVNLETIESSIIEEKPDLVCIDGIYLMKSSQIKSKSRFDRIAEIIELTKAMAKRNKVPVIITTQMNRAPKDSGGSKANLDRLAFSDNMGMIADYVFFINQTSEQREQRVLELQPVKIREAEFIDNIEIHWDFETQNFDETTESIKKTLGNKYQETEKKDKPQEQKTYGGDVFDVPDNMPDDIPF